MFKAKYKYCPESLNFIKIHHSTKQKIARVSLFVLSFLGFTALLSFLIFTYFFNTSSYQSLLREKNQLLAQYDKLNKQVVAINQQLEDISNRDNEIYRVILAANPIPSTVRNAGIGGVSKYEHLKGFNNSNLLIETSKKVDDLSRKVKIQAKSYSDLVALARYKSKELESVPAIEPLQRGKYHLTSFFGYRVHPIFRKRQMHEGLDFTAPVGTPVYATGNGVVTEAEYTGGFGRTVAINHGFGYKSSYSHLSKINVSQGQKITRGQLIGYVGSSGLSTGAHLHYEIQKDGVKVDPIHYFFTNLSPVEYSEMLETAKLATKNQ
jgi:murein DD-endopeptidase MepM/ murein hydrolase activator NlpD